MSNGIIRLVQTRHGASLQP